MFAYARLLFRLSSRRADFDRVANTVGPKVTGDHGRNNVAPASKLWYDGTG